MAAIVPQPAGLAHDDAVRRRTALRNRHDCAGEEPAGGLSETPGSVRAPGPEYGQHTELPLTEELDYSWDDVPRLTQRSQPGRTSSKR